MLQGIIWQPENSHAHMRGRWHELGVTKLLVQWTVVDGWAFVPGTGGQETPQLPDWARITQEPWAQEVILGLAGYFSENKARASLEELGALSREVAKIAPFAPDGWYFPVEIDPTWTELPLMVPILEELPRPLWVSAYDSTPLRPEVRHLGGPDVLAAALTWLPQDVGVFFQDGVGVGARTPGEARAYADVLSQSLGPKRLRVIAEAFRLRSEPTVDRRFRSATADELVPQIRAYQGHEVYLFDGPHYVSDQLVGDLKVRLGLPMR